MRTHVRLNLYERGIVTSLVEQEQLSPESARELVVRYIDVIRSLGGYDNCDDYAERLVSASRTGYTPANWLAKIKEIEKQELLDKRMIDREHGSEYAHL